jgi:hypothetical protein
LARVFDDFVCLNVKLTARIGHRPLYGVALTSSAIRKQFT